MADKSFWKSKTFWFNALALVAAIAASFGYGEFVADPNLEQYALVAVTVINLVLRFATSTGLSVK